MVGKVLWKGKKAGNRDQEPAYETQELADSGLSDRRPFAEFSSTT